MKAKGNHAEDLFARFVPSAKKSASSKLGDVTLTINKVAYHIEIKYCKSNTVNQVRAIKYTTIVIYAPSSKGNWIVIPAHEVARMVMLRSRGQHTEIAFECAVLTLSTISDKFRCTNSKLSTTVKTAIRASIKFERKIKAIYNAAYIELKAVDARIKRQVANVLTP